MKPYKPDNFADLFHVQLSQMLNMSHFLVRLSEQMAWVKLEAEIDAIYRIGLHHLKYTFRKRGGTLDRKPLLAILL